MATPPAPARLPSVPALKTSTAYVPTGDQPQAIEQLSAWLARGRALPDAARRDRHRQDGDDGVDHRAGAEAGARSSRTTRRSPRSSATSSASSSRQRRRVLRLLLRLLPARGVRPPGRPVHREGLVAERRHRAAAARGDVGALHAPRRDRRRLGLVHLRPRLAGGVARARALPRGRRGARPRPGAAQADRQPVRPQRHRARPRPLPRQGRRRRDPAGEPGDRVPHLVLRRRGRADHALRPAHAARSTRSSTTSRSGRRRST